MIQVARDEEIIKYLKNNKTEHSFQLNLVAPFFIEFI